MRVLVADDDEHVRSALRLLLEQEVDMQVVGESAAVDDIVDEVARTEAGVVLLDWDLPGLHAAGVLARMRLVHPRPRLIALSGRPEERMEALQAGVDAFVSKGDAPETLLATLRDPVDQARGQMA